MITHPRSHWVVRGLCLGMLMLAPTGAAAQESKSGPLAKELAQFLDRAKTNTVAAKDPAAEDQYVAALYFAGSQLLVVSARYSAPIFLDQKIEQKNFMDVYIDLNSASIPDSKIFVSDLMVDGLQARPNENQPFDTFESATGQWAFNRDWRGRKISEEEYMEQFRQADERYARMLGVLLARLKKSN